jgi:hypothetical protein
MQPRNQKGLQETTSGNGVQQQIHYTLKKQQQTDAKRWSTAFGVPHRIITFAVKRLLTNLAIK